MIDVSHPHTGEHAGSSPELKYIEVFPPAASRSGSARGLSTPTSMPALVLVRPQCTSTADSVLGTRFGMCRLIAAPPSSQGHMDVSSSCVSISERSPLPHAEGLMKVTAEVSSSIPKSQPVTREGVTSYRASRECPLGRSF